MNDAREAIARALQPLLHVGADVEGLADAVLAAVPLSEGWERVGGVCVCGFVRTEDMVPSGNKFGHSTGGPDPDFCGPVEPVFAARRVDGAVPPQRNLDRDRTDSAVGAVPPNPERAEIAEGGRGVSGSSPDAGAPLSAPPSSPNDEVERRLTQERDSFRAARDFWMRQCADYREALIAARPFMVSGAEFYDQMDGAERDEFSHVIFVLERIAEGEETD